MFIGQIAQLLHLLKKQLFSAALAHELLQLLTGLLEAFSCGRRMGSQLDDVVTIARLDWRCNLTDLELRDGLLKLDR